MPNPCVAITARLSRWMHALGAARHGITRRAVVARDWVSLGVSGPTPLLEMYRDILGKHGIQAVTTDTGVGPGALGGVPGFGMLRVLASDVVRARDILRTETGEDETDVSLQLPGESERINGRSE